MIVAVRLAVPGEYAEIGRLTVAAYTESGQLGAATGYERVLADVVSRAADGTVLVAVDTRTDRLLGSVTFVLPGSRYAELAGPDEAEFRMLAVDPAAQGLGVGRLLVDECLRRAAEAGRGAVVICCRDFVVSAQRLYTSMGFHRIPERDWVPAPEVNLLALRKPLP
ncbi:GNAT family N-acetyltransferase [Planosporangium mesophilum]|uniref:N-acetyltransferase n=1 Tax=Planosporangium mesophilum TaxID=689768 RepID=A0A8J3T735_9ACTN|nr:GNAT family N-acetyltransferase [Planosporangium mesophilum]NJC81294.1 GNAT family N-acetyltransferase [Planosporangium mesophilum]GII21054.1 N-acetyltransferase [Planosporangium mesophilum]